VNENFGFPLTTTSPDISSIVVSSFHSALTSLTFALALSLETPPTGTPTLMRF